MTAYMEKQINITYPNGHMTINLEEFFPASLKDIKRLLSTVNMDWEHKDEIIQTIILWLMDEKDLCEHYSKEYAKRCVDVRPKTREAEAKVQEMQVYINSIASWKKTPEYKQIKAKFKGIQNEYRHLKNLQSSYNSSFKGYNIRKEKLQKNIEMLKDRR